MRLLKGLLGFWVAQLLSVTAVPGDSATQQLSN